MEKYFLHFLILSGKSTKMKKNKHSMISLSSFTLVSPSERFFWKIAVIRLAKSFSNHCEVANSEQYVSVNELLKNIV